MGKARAKQQQPNQQQKMQEREARTQKRPVAKVKRAIVISATKSQLLVDECAKKSTDRRIEAL